MSRDTSRRVPTSISLSPALRHQIEEARERSGRSLSHEVEARLRASLNLQGADELLLLKVDNGLMSWLKAFVAGPGFFGDLQATAVYLIRSHLLEMMEHDVWYSATVPKLPEPTRSYVMSTPKYLALKGRAA